MADDRKTLGERVNGVGFDQSEFSAEERSRIRQTHHILHDEFKTPDSLLGETNPSHLAKHLGLGWISGPSLFIRDNKAFLATAAAIIGALNWQKIADIAQLLAEVVK